MAVKHVWDTTAADSRSEELAYFATLGFAVPVAAGHICALPLKNMLDWLLRPCGPPLVEGDEANIHSNVPHWAFAVLAVPRFLYGPGGMPSNIPMVGLGVVFVPPYVKKISFTEAYFFLNQWVKIGLEPLKQEQVMFLHSCPKSAAVPTCNPIHSGWILLQRTLSRKLQNMLHCTASELSASTGSWRWLQTNLQEG